MEEYQLTLDKRANVSNNLARGASIFIIPLVIYLLSEEEPSPELIIFTMTLVATAFQIFMKDIINFCNAKIADYRFTQQEGFLKEALKDFKYQYDPFQAHDLNSSYFSINFVNMSYGNKEQLSGKAIANIFKNCCEYYNVNVEFQRGNYVEISGNNSLSAGKAKSLNTFFAECVAREIKIRQLSEQVKTLSAIITSKQYALVKMPGVDANNLPITNFTIRFSNNLGAKIIENLQTIFANYQFTFNQLDDCNEATITGVEPLDPKLFAGAIKDLNTFVEVARTKYISPSWQEETTSTPRYRGANKKGKEDVEQEEIKEVIEKSPKMSAKPRVVKCPSGTYDSSEDNNTIYPIPFGKVHDKRAYGKARFFITNRLNYDKALEGLDKSVRDDVEKKINDMVQKIRFKSKKGEQGLVPWRSKELNQDGKKIQTSTKGKVLGEFGKIRFFTSSEISPTGENLLAIEGVDLTHCAKIKTK